MSPEKNKQNMVSGSFPLVPVILAAGESRRMGSPKPFLTLHGKTFLETIANRLRQAGVSAPGVIVYNASHRDQIKELQLPGFCFVPNRFQEKGQLYSVQLALGEIPPDCTGILLCLADHPLVNLATYSIIKERHEALPGNIVIPVFQGRRGHPPVFPRRVFHEILDLSIKLPGGLKNVLSSNREKIRELDVDDPGILADLDTPGDLSRFAGDKKV